MSYHLPSIAPNDRKSYSHFIKNCVYKGRGPVDWDSFVAFIHGEGPWDEGVGLCLSGVMEGLESIPHDGEYFLYMSKILSTKEGWDLLMSC